MKNIKCFLCGRNLWKQCKRRPPDEAGERTFAQVIPHGKGHIYVCWDCACHRDVPKLVRAKLKRLERRAAKVIAAGKALLQAHPMPIRRQ